MLIMSAKNMTMTIRDQLTSPILPDIFKNLNHVDHVVNFQRVFGISPRTRHNNLMTISQNNFDCHHKTNTNSRQSTKTTIITHHESVIESISWYYFFRTMSSLANEKFTTLLFAYLFWNSDNLVARQLILAWFFVLFSGQLLKDILKIPRPASPPVVVFESNYANEYGMPSTHAMVGTSIPIVMSFLLSKRFQFPLVPMLLASVIWSIPICMSRLYLGMHSILEILTGLFLTVIILSIVLPLLDFLDFSILTCSYWIPISISITTFLAYIYPNPLLYSPTRGDSCTSLGAFSGLTIGSWLNYRYLDSKILSGTIYSTSNEDQSLSFNLVTINQLVNIVVIQCLRWLIGIFVVLAGREILNKLVYSFLCWLHSLDTKNKLTKYDKRVEIPLKLIVYTYVGAALSCFSPLAMGMFSV